MRAMSLLSVIGISQVQKIELLQVYNYNYNAGYKLRLYCREAVTHQWDTHTHKPPRFSFQKESTQEESKPTHFLTGFSEGPKDPNVSDTKNIYMKERNLSSATHGL